jgi:peptidoglycan/LPS O-acetylase OafA/YrhL
LSIAPAPQRVRAPAPEAAVVPEPRGRLPGIEGLRALAAAAILVHHTWAGGFQPGAESRASAVFLNLAFGVTLFFALSGFLLYRPFATSIARAAPLPDLRDYLRNRALRILPAYWAILAVAGLVLQSTALRDAEGEITQGALSDPGDFLKAALLIHDYDPSTLAIGIGPAWSLAVEVVFYLLLPLLVMAAAALARRQRGRRGRVKALLAPPLFLLLLGLSGKFVAGVVVPAPPSAGFNSDWHSVIERSFWAQADLFAFGMVAAVAYAEFQDGRLRLPRRWRAGFLVLAAVITVPAAISLDRAQLSYLPQNTAVALAAGLLVAAVAFPEGRGRRPWCTRLLESRALVAAGLVSYSVFLWHEPVLRWLRGHGVQQPGWDGLVFNLIITSMIVAVLAPLTYRLIELPALRRKRGGSASSRELRAAQAETAP